MSDEKLTVEPIAETIEEAKPQQAEAPKEAAISLQERLAKATEQKSFTRPETKQENKSAMDNSGYSFLGSDDDFEQEPAEQKTEPTKTSEPLTKDFSNPKPEKSEPITDKTKRASARTAVGMIDLVQKGIFTPLQNYKFSKKFSKEQKEKILDIEDKAYDELDKEERVLKTRWNRLLYSHTKKVDAIPFNEREKTDMEEAFYQYFDYKEKTLPPEWFVAMAVVKSLGDRTIDVIMD